MKWKVVCNQEKATFMLERFLVSKGATMQKLMLIYRNEQPGSH